eukprot:GHVN01085174.1.p1 GENE.GHVN01085174.1~~GHVN01085174.1.p1  ORF type:complete len:176 (+),score=31.31 GHVN01085174.1:204-731(+)
MMSDIPSVKPPLGNGVGTGMCSRLFSPIALMWSGLSRLSHRRVFVPSLSFCALFASVLDTGSVMTAYLTWRGVLPVWVGVSRSGAAVTGIGATFIFPYLMRVGLSVEKCGLFSIWLFWLLILPVGVSFMIFGESMVSDVVLMISVAVSRVGLWGFDLTETLITQKYVCSSEREVC